MEIPDEVIDTAMHAVEQQLESTQTPYVKMTFDSLVNKQSISPDDAKDLIAQALAIVINRMLLDKRPFDTTLYKQLLSALPALPDESGK